ncbi:hypothetical protein [Pontimicrobium sp. IMCC45349]|uniref:hypothetical protein n=1 Tax=Pontimicrobium sp. IMCC45349 TaxID=3391574 RepID=UPI0039A164D5
MKIIYPLRLLIILCSFLLLNSCIAAAVMANQKNVAEKHITTENNAIPPEFGKDNSTLICVLKGRNSRDKYMKKHFNENYKGKFIFVLEEDLENEEYADLDKYRYIFDYDAGSTASAGYGASGEFKTRSAPYSNYYMLDRKTDEYYYSDVKTGSFGKVILTYAQKLESLRLQNL